MINKKIEINNKLCYLIDVETDGVDVTGIWTLWRGRSPREQRAIWGMDVYDMVRNDLMRPRDKKLK